MKHALKHWTAFACVVERAHEATVPLQTLAQKSFVPAPPSPGANSHVVGSPVSAIV
jgi:hypothetical protein